MEQMSSLNVPLDFERLPEYRLYLDALAVARDVPAATAAVAGLFGFFKLWVALGYEAAHTNEPGLLTVSGQKLWAMEVGSVDAPHLLLAMAAGGVLVKREDGTFFCDRFARLNAHLSGNHEKKESKAARHSAIVRNRDAIAAEASAQALLLPPEIYRSSEGVVLESADVNRVLVHIRTLDRCLGQRERYKGQYSQGLIADAHASLVDIPLEARARDAFYYWFNDHREHPALPRTTEQLLAQWPVVMAMKKGSNE